MDQAAISVATADLDLNIDDDDEQQEENSEKPDFNTIVHLDEQTTLSSFISCKLLAHQVDGIKFLWKNLILNNSGCILADYMGLFCTNFLK